MADKFINATALLEQMPEVPYKGSLRRVLMQAPAADVVPVRHGRWIKPTRVPDSMLDECSLCGFDCGAYTFNYCPNCGALMDKEANE